MYIGIGLKYTIGIPNTYRTSLAADPMECNTGRYRNRSRSPQRHVPFARTPLHFRTWATRVLSSPEHAAEASRIIETLTAYYATMGPATFTWRGDIHVGDANMGRRWRTLSRYVYDLRQLNLSADYERASVTGLNPTVQRSIALSPDFIIALTNILNDLRRFNVPSSQAIYIHCEHGIHRSVAIACILQNLFLGGCRLVFHRRRVARALDAD